MKIGILGGTFDPIHLGHLDAALTAKNVLALDRVLLLPSRTPPHRNMEPRASIYHRFAMIVLAASSREGLLASDLELRRDGPSYTSLTLEALQADGLSPSQLFFIIGADAFAEIATWYDYPRLLKLANFAVVSRPGAAPQSPIPKGDNSASTSIVHVNANTPDVSSTDIRRRVANGESIDGLVPRDVAEHIRRHRLYVPAPVAAVM
ncbi:MAG TPA: nicotinate-nucleotide adenylyltransferase [Vicinamibacterales bacterium]|nr:nicotinate-nucleotide adenylyltransferase [Vicinamibacterales bacterium]